MHDGERFGRLVAVRDESVVGRHLWRFRCDCGSEIVRLAALVRSPTRGLRSCGCAKRTRDGATRVPEFRIWTGMLRRCTHPHESGYKNYGGRGISVCERWLSFENFLADMGRRPSRKHSIDRINNDGHYEPGNCRWATQKVQANNQRRSIRLYHHGRRITVAQIADRLGLSRMAVMLRLRRGATVAQILRTPKRPDWKFRRAERLAAEKGPAC